jgi:hypothetical protein
MYRQLTRRGFLGATAGLTLAKAADSGATPRISLTNTAGEKISFRAGDRLLFEYRYTSTRPKTYVHPLCAPDGSPLTLDGPEDHIHHRGVLLGWSDVNGYEFFGEDNPGLPKGRIVHQRFEQITGGPVPLVTAVNHWVGGNEVILTERRTITALPPVDGTVRMQWDSELKAAKPDTVLRAGKAVYNGLGIRLIRSMDGGRVLNSSGADTVAEVNGESASWAAYTGALPSGETAGVAIFDHPSNPRHPTPFFVMNRFGYISAAPTFREALPLDTATALKLRFAVVTFMGETRRDNLEKSFRLWSSLR